MAPGTLTDVYDGRVWNEFLNPQGRPFPYNLALNLNIDWFQPFKHTQLGQFICQFKTYLEMKGTSLTLLA